MSTPKKPEKINDDLPHAILLSELSTETLEVLEHFGIEAPHLLNQYCIKVEDALITVCNKCELAQQEITYLKDLLKQHKISYDEFIPNSPSDTTD